MRPLRAWWIRLTGLFSAGRRSEQFDEELRSHLAMHIEDNLRQGMTPGEARRQALIALGGMQSARDAYRDRGGMPALESLVQDFRFAVRALRKSPGFTAAATLVLALGIGANGATFSLVNALLLRPLNGGHLRGEFVGLYSGHRTRPELFRAFSYPEYVDIRQQNDVFNDLLAESVARPGLTEGRLTRRVTAGLVSSNYFSTLGVEMAAGRAFTLDEERPGSAAAVVIVSHSYWRQHGLTPDIVGRSVTVSGHEMTIVGVAPQGFAGTMPVFAHDLWLPLGAAPLVSDGQDIGPSNRIVNDRSAQSLLLAGTLREGTSAEVAQSRLAALASSLEAAYPQYNSNQRLVVHPRSRVSMGPRPRSDAAPAAGAVVLMLIAGLVLVVACLNLANILFARGTVRRREIAIRLALGGSRARVLRQLLVEGLLLSAMGGATALMAAWWAASRLIASLTPVIPMSISIDVSPDGRVVMAIALASVASTLLFAFGPAWKLSRPDLATALKQSAPTGAARTRRVGLPGLLVGTQVALSVAMLIAAGVFLRASLTAASTDPGFPLSGGLLAEVDARMASQDESRGRATYAALLDRVRALPGVRSASVASLVPFGLTQFDREVDHDGTITSATFNVVGAGYFATLGLPVIAGREFTLAEERDPAIEPVAIVDRILADRLFMGASPIGQSVRVSDLFMGASPIGQSTGSSARDEPGELKRIVGVVAAVRDDVLSPPNAHIYVPFGRHYRGEMTLHARTDAGSEAAMLEPVRAAIQGVDARLPVLSVRTMTNHRDVTPSLWALTFAAKLFAAFGIIAAALATAGVYGLRAYLVSQRTREIGIRVALGATRRRVIGQLVQEGTSIAGAGLVVGALIAVGLVQLLRQSGLLDERGAIDPLVFTMAPLVLGVTTAVASYLPARLALRVDPVVALRPE
jgi:predicted permease